MKKSALVFWSTNHRDAARTLWVLSAPPYSPDLNPIEQAFAKLKSLLRAAAARSVEALWSAIGAMLDHFKPNECANYLVNSGYPRSACFCSRPWSIATQLLASANRISRARLSLFSRLLSVAALALTGCAPADPGFYQPAPQDLAGPPGTLIRAEPMPFSPEGAAAYRVLYRSRGLRDEPIAVSGVVVVPNGPRPAEGRPIVAWAHPTSGVVPRCAPSLALFIFQQIQGLREMTARGYVIAATDYPGLGTAGPHPYLVGVSEARAVLDSVRVARFVSGGGRANQFAVWGHSQGGQAALFTGLLAGSYAPDLTLVGVAAAAPATELATLLTDDFDSVGGKNLTAMTLWSWARVFNAPINAVVEPAAIPVVDRLAGECIESIYDLLVRRRTERPLQRTFLSVLSVPSLAALEPWRSLTISNSPGTLPPNVPVFLAQGTSDRLVWPAVTRDYFTRLCRAGSNVRMFWMPGVSHGFAGRDSAAAAVNWIANRFEGQQAPSDCSDSIRGAEPDIELPKLPVAH